MIDELIKLGLSEKDIKDKYEYISDFYLNDFKDNLNLLRNIGCKENNIINIINSNPFFLERDNNDISELIKYLLSLNFTRLDNLFISYPLILNKDRYEIENLVYNLKNKGMGLEDIINLIESNPSIVDEV